MTIRAFRVFPILLLLLTQALQDSEVCYILDGILFLYGIILTSLYCRLKVSVWGTPKIRCLGAEIQARQWNFCNSLSRYLSSWSVLWAGCPSCTQCGVLFANQSIARFINPFIPLHLMTPIIPCIGVESGQLNGAS
uniref:Uncharacterized protein n=1 Tax=Naja naja TaxID=35670 RepID=A0A8C6VN85_NAJNA